jgi:hypothetical protein
MDNKQIVPFNHAAKALVPVKEEPRPLAIIPPPEGLVPPARGIPAPQPPRRPPSLPPPQGQRQAFFAQPVAAREERLRREADLKKPIRIPSWMDVKKPREGERLVDVKMDEHGNTRVHKYSTTPRVTIDGVRAEPSQVKKIPMMEAAQRMSTGRKKNKRTVADLIKDVDFLFGMCSNIQKTHATLTKSVLNLYNLDTNKRRREQDGEHEPKKGKGPM